MPMQRSLWILTLLLSGLIAGFFFAFSADVNLATAYLSAEEYVRVQQLINLKVRNAVFALVYFGAAVAPGMLLAASWRDWRTMYFRIVAAGYLLYFAGAFLVTREINVPINNEMALWNPQQVPAVWSVMRDRWNDANLFRTMAAVLSFACYLYAFSSPPKRQGLAGPDGPRLF
jgi:uncharacterized membrane protein